MPSVSEDVRNALIDHDIDLRRVDGGIQRRVTSILRRLHNNLRSTTVNVGAHEAKRNDAQERRLRKLQNESRDLIREAFAEIATLVHSDMRRLVVLESRKLVDTIHEQSN